LKLAKRKILSFVFNIALETIVKKKKS